MIESANVVNIDQDKLRAVVFCVARNKDSFLCIVLKRKLGNTGKLCWCFYVGLTKEQYDRIYDSEKVKQDRFSFVGIAGDAVFVPSSVSDALLMIRPEHFVGIHLWEGQMNGTDGEALTQHCVSLCNEVMEILA